MEQRVALLVAQRRRLLDALAGMPVTVWPSQANFILWRPEGRSGPDVWRELLERSVLVRDCSSWPRLSGCLRVTVGREKENDRFLAALSEVLGS
jgi:histidinol-phosphate aminotransferase